MKVLEADLGSMRPAFGLDRPDIGSGSLKGLH